MNQTTPKQDRVLAIAPSARGFGFAVMEGDIILECGNKRAEGNKNQHSISKIERLMNLFQPSVLVLPDVNVKGCRRAPRIKALHRQAIGLVEKRKCKFALISGNRLRIALLGDASGTKHQMAEILAQKFPAELAGKLPPKRRSWENEDGRMGIFDAVELATVFRMKSGRNRSLFGNAGSQDNFFAKELKAGN